MYMVICGTQPLCNAQGVFLFENENERNALAIEHQQKTNSPVTDYMLLKCAQEHVLRLSFTGKPYVDARFPGVY